MFLNIVHWSDAEWEEYGLCSLLLCALTEPVWVHSNS
jgi:hypothetical protein